MSAPDFTARALALKALETAPLSAYEVAVANGFVGDEPAWLASLVGPEGPAGPQGAMGPAGDDGTQGPPGADGADGAQGADGADGADGFGAELGDPGGDRLLGWDESAGSGGAAAFFEAGAGLAFNGAVLDARVWQVLASQAGVSGVSAVSFTDIPAWVNEIALRWDNVDTNGAGSALLYLYDGATWSGLLAFGAFDSSNFQIGGIDASNTRRDYGLVHCWGYTAGVSTASSPHLSSLARNVIDGQWRIDGGIDGIRVATNSGNFTAGNFHLYGRA